MKNYSDQGFKHFGDQGKKPQRYSKDSFTKELIGQTVKVSLLGSKEMSGELLELGMYDAKVQTVEGPVIVMKSAILTIQVMP